MLGRTGGQILELGAGTGAHGRSRAHELADRGTLPERYAILEVSADLAARQREHLALLPRGLRERVVWLDALPAAAFDGVILANEVADALPCRRFVCRRRLGSELGVSVGPAANSWRSPRGPMRRWCRRARRSCRSTGAPLPDGYVSELSLSVGPWIAALGACLGSGALLLLDYGLAQRHYYHPQRATGTLRCHFRQRVHDDPYINVGVQDITAWVDFTRVAEAGMDAGLSVAGFATQAAFLRATGLEELVGAAADDRERARLAGEARRLIMPEEMGEAFKAMALTRGLDAPPLGFALQDLRDLL